LILFLLIFEFEHFNTFQLFLKVTILRRQLAQLSQSFNWIGQLVNFGVGLPTEPKSFQVSAVHFKNLISDANDCLVVLKFEFTDNQVREADNL